MNWTLAPAGRPWVVRGWVAFGFLACCGLAQPALADSCSDLANSTALTSLPTTAITSAQTLSGTFTPPDGTPAIPGLPSFCRITATLTPTPVSDIKIEIWLPSSGWNGRLQGVGNGGLAGSITYTALAPAIQAGYASVSTDTGHTTTDNSWLPVDARERDYGYRSIHLMTVTAKAAIAAFYGSGPNTSYFNGCSTGGGQGFGEAQLYPDDYNGILAGAPQDFPTHIRADVLWNAKAALVDPASYIPTTKLPQITAAVLAQCGGPEAVADGFLQDAQRCHFNPERLLCQPGQDPNTDACFSAAQVLTMRKLYQGAVDPQTDELLWPGFLPGDEGPTNSSGGGVVTWATEIAGPQPFSTGPLFYGLAVLDDPSWAWQTMNFTTDVQLADQKYPYLNHVSTDLSSFTGAGRKLLIYHGYADPLISTQNTANYYGKLVQTVQSQRRMRDFNQALSLVQDSVRVFMVPGMGHCGGGPGAVSFDALTPLVQWVEKGTAPATIAAQHVDATSQAVTFSRPLCPYPQVARYSGSGDRTQAGNWSCEPGRFSFDPNFYADWSNPGQAHRDTDIIHHPITE